MLRHLQCCYHLFCVLTQHQREIGLSAAVLWFNIQCSLWWQSLIDATESMCIVSVYHISSKSLDILLRYDNLILLKVLAVSHAELLNLEQFVG